MDPTPELYRMLKAAFECMLNVESAVQPLQEAKMFHTKHGEYGSEMARRMTTDPKTSPCKSSTCSGLVDDVRRIHSTAAVPCIVACCKESDAR
jgi:hypothetical protein